jgi:CubicO group peptidase (beta-lactamase class C family)
MGSRKQMKMPTCLGVLAFLLTEQLARAAGPPGELDRICANALRVGRVPALSVVVVRGDKVIYLKGFGVRRTGQPDPVTPDTLFPLASCTKAFTATALGLLVDDGKLAWDNKVTKHLPWFRLKDPLANREVTVRDLLCHRYGLNRHEKLWSRAPWSLEETVRKMAKVEPSFPFRTKFSYNNLGYIAGGLIIASAAKEDWDSFVRKRLLQPLGMKSTVFKSSDALKSKNHATPHRRGPKGALVPIAWYPDDKQIRASGSIKTNIRDLSGWLRLQLNDGTLGDKRVISTQALAETRTPQIVLPLSRARAQFEGTTQVSYGLGWQIRDYRGHKVISHGGSTDGFRARVVFAPDDNFAFALLTNVSDTLFTMATANMLLDHLLDLKKRDWHTHFAQKGTQDLD